MDLAQYYPFTKLRLPLGDVVAWTATNPTFHRSSEYGLVITQIALYTFYARLPWFTRWRRVPFTDVVSVEFRDSRWRPKLILKHSRGSTTFSTPYDAYTDEMDYDRKILAEAASLIARHIAGSATSA